MNFRPLLSLLSLPELLCLLLVAGIVTIGLAPANVPFTQDCGTSFAVARALLNGDTLLLGPPSHLGGRHLGPIYYFTVALSLLFSGGDTFRLIVLAALLKIALLVFIFLLLRDLLPSGRAVRWSAVIGITATLVGTDYLLELRDPWHAYLLLPMGGIFFWSTWRVVRDGMRGIPLFLLGASLFIQTHFATLPIVLIAAALLCWHLIRERSVIQGDSVQFGPTQGLTLLLVALSWLPAVVYELIYPSNLVALFRANVTQPDGKAFGLGEIVLGMRHTGEYILRHSLIAPNSQSRLIEILSWSATLACVAVLISFLRAGTHKVRVMVLILGLPVLTFPIVLARIPGEYFPYYPSGLLAIPLIFAGLISGWACEIFKTIYSESKVVRISRPFVAAAALGFSSVVIIAILNINRELALVSRGVAARWHTLAHATAIAQIIRRDAGADRTIDLVARGQSEISREAILYELGDLNFSGHTHAKWFEELAHAKDPSQTDPSMYLLFCPRTNWDARRKVLRAYSSNRNNRRDRDEVVQRWETDAQLDLRNCDACRNCELWRLKRRT